VIFLLKMNKQNFGEFLCFNCGLIYKCLKKKKLNSQIIFLLGLFNNAIKRKHSKWMDPPQKTNKLPSGVEYIFSTGHISINALSQEIGQVRKTGGNSLRWCLETGWCFEADLSSKIYRYVFFLPFTFDKNKQKERQKWLEDEEETKD